MESVTKRGPGRPVDDSIRTRRQEQILDAAAKFFASRGYSEANIQELADVLQVGKGTIYRYFPSKENLFLATVDRMMRKLTEAIDASIEAADDPVEQLSGAIRAYLRFFAEHPEATELLIQERAHFKDRKQPTYFVYREANTLRRSARIRALIDEGRFRNIPVERIGDVVGDLLYGTMFTNYFIGRDRAPDEQAADLLDIVLYGILSDSERWARGLNTQRQSPEVGRRQWECRHESSTRVESSPADTT
jgi:AcrR family transcriptional regulator